MLGQMNYMGVGTDVNLPRAVEYFNQAANQGDATAKAYLAQMHAQGDGVPQDNSTAFKLYQEAADGVSAGPVQLLDGKGLYDTASVADQWWLSGKPHAINDSSQL
jgi:TPR repeat protein